MPLAAFLPDPDNATRLQPLINQLESESYDEREAASHALESLPALPGHVRDLATTEQRPESRLRLGKLVAAFPLETENRRLSGILTDIEARATKGLLDPIVRVMQRGVWSPDGDALHGASRATAEPADLPLINRCLVDPAPLIRRIGAAALGGIPAGDSDERLAGLLDDRDPTVALLAAAALAERSDRRCLSTYARWLDADDFETRYRCHGALLGLTNRNFGYDPSAEEDARRAPTAKWRKWTASGKASITGSLPRESAIVLFNGRDLHGWEVQINGKVIEKSPAWEVRNGGLLCNGVERGDLWTKTRHENYVLTLEYKADADASDSGVGILLTEAAERGPDGPGYLEIQLLPGKAGDLYQIGGIKAEARGAPINFSSPRLAEVTDPAGQWHKLRLTVNKGSAEVAINGAIVSRAEKGPIGPGRILLRNEGNPFSFRRLLLHPLGP